MIDPVSVLCFSITFIVYSCSGVRRCRRCRCCRLRRRRRSPFSNMNISEASRPIAIKLYLKHHWVWGKAAWVCGADQFRTLVSMATDSSHRVIMGKTASSRFLESFFIGSFSYLQVTMTCMRAWMSSKFGRIRPKTTELAALERMKKSHSLIMGKTMSSHFLRYF